MEAGNANREHTYKMKHLHFIVFFLLYMINIKGKRKITMMVGFMVLLMLHFSNNLKVDFF